MARVHAKEVKVDNPQDWTPEQKAEAVQLYGPDRNWRALHARYGEGFCRRHKLPATVKEWAAELEAGQLLLPEETGTAGRDHQDQDQDREGEPAWAGDLRQALTLANWSGVAAIVEPRFREGLQRLARSRTSRDFLAETQAIRTMVETVRRLKEESPLEADRGHATDAAIARFLDDLEEKFQFQDPERMAERLRDLGWTVLGPGLQAGLPEGPAVARQEGQEEPSGAPVGHGIPRGSSGAPGASERPRESDEGPVRRRGPRVVRSAPDDGLSDQDRERLAQFRREEQAPRDPGGWP
jgi:hypothetical protein